MSHMLERLRWEPLQGHRAVARLTTMKKILCGRVAINCNDYLERSSIRTRAASMPNSNIIVPTVEHRSISKLILSRTLPLWNGTPDHADQVVNTLTEVSGYPMALITSLD